MNGFVLLARNDIVVEEISDLYIYWIMLIRSGYCIVTLHLGASCLLGIYIEGS